MTTPQPYASSPPPDTADGLLPPFGNTGVETGHHAHVAWLHGSARAENDRAEGHRIAALLRRPEIGSTLTGNSRHYQTGVRADDWSWLVQWGGLGDARGTVYAEVRQSVWESAADPAHLLRTLCAAIRPSRLDLASDVDDGDRPATLFLRRDRAWTRTRRGSWTLLQRGDGGETLNVGSRTSDRFLRIYVKGPQTIRHEIELKGTTARQAATALVAGGPVFDVFTAEYGRIVRWPSS
jgi:hypothetical protein